MLDDIYARMTKRGVTMLRSTYDAAVPLVSRLLAYEVDRYVFGADAEFRRKVTDDKLLLEAERLLAGAHSQHEVFDRTGVLGNAKKPTV